MSHDLEIIKGEAQMFSGMGMRPWHGMGKIIPGRLTAAEAIKAAGLDWQVDLHPVTAQVGDKTIATAHRAVVRSTDNAVLGVVGPSYSPLQNADVFSVLDPLISNQEAVWETAGSLWGGKAVWAMAKLPQEIVIRRPGGRTDEVRGYLLGTNRHDGWAAAAFKLTPIRVVCQNTLTMALRGGAYRITHVGDMAERVKAATEALHLANTISAELQGLYQAMADKEMTQDQTLAYFRRCLKAEVTDDVPEADQVEAAGEPQDALPRRLNRLLELNEAGRGADLVRGTLWGAYNACVELIDHDSAFRTQDSREAAVLIENSTKRRAFREAVALVGGKKRI